MDVSKELQTAMRAVMTGGFKSMRDYDEAITNLRNLLSEEHRHITTHEDGERCSNEFGEMCQNFVADVYFGGVWLTGLDVGLRRLSRRLKSAVSGHLRKKIGVNGKTVAYVDELSEARIQMMAKESVCEAVEAKFSPVTREKLLELRSAKKP